MQTTDISNILKKKIVWKRKVSNEQILLINFFEEKTKIRPEYVFISKEYILFMIKDLDYFKASNSIYIIRRSIKHKKVIIIHQDNIFLNQIFSFFPDIHIQDVKAQEIDGILRITVYLISYEQRGIALGNSGKYISLINEIIKNNISFSPFKIPKEKMPIKLECKFIPLNSYI